MMLVDSSKEKIVSNYTSRPHSSSRLMLWNAEPAIGIHLQTFFARLDWFVVDYSFYYFNLCRRIHIEIDVSKLAFVYTKKKTRDQQLIPKI